MVLAGAGQSSLFYNSPQLNLSLSGTDQSTEIRRRTATPVMKSVKTALVLITLMLVVGVIKEEIKIVFIIIRYQDFLVEFKVGDFCTRDESGIVSV